MEQYMSKTRGNYRSGVVRPKINDKTYFELKGQYLKELHENTFSGSEHEDANEHVEKFLEIIDLFHILEILNSKGAIPTKTIADEKIAIQEMAKYFQKLHNGTSSKARSTKTSNRLDAIQAQLNNLRREIKKVNEKTDIGRITDQFMAESVKRHEENSNVIKEIRASTDVAIRNQGALIKTLNIQIGKISKVLQERGIKVPFPRRLQDYCCEAQDVKILESYDHTLPQKEKDPGSFTLPCFIHNVCFNKALVNLRESASVMPFSTYTNLGLGILSRLTIELAGRTIKQPKSIAKNVLVMISKFIFPIDFIILDIPEDDDVPLILVDHFYLLPIPRLMFTKENLH
nr:hypothetical protein [Tanacetum cinerariifolium]